MYISKTLLNASVGVSTRSPLLGKKMNVDIKQHFNLFKETNEINFTENKTSEQFIDGIEPNFPTNCSGEK